MKTVKTLVVLSLVSAALGIGGVQAALQSPRAQENQPKIVSGVSKDTDRVHHLTALGNAAKGKMHSKISGVAADPNLLNCWPIGKATCTTMTSGGRCCKK